MILVEILYNFQKNTKRKEIFTYICTRFTGVLSITVIINAGVVELVDTPDLGSGAARCGSSSLPARTK